MQPRGAASAASEEAGVTVQVVATQDTSSATGQTHAQHAPATDQGPDTSSLGDSITDSSLVEPADKPPLNKRNSYYIRATTGAHAALIED